MSLKYEVRSKIFKMNNFVGIDIDIDIKSYMYDIPEICTILYQALN